MPVTGWKDVAGKACELCGGPATHYYGTALICCSCHVGEKDGGLVTEAQAKAEHQRVLEERKGE